MSGGGLRCGRCHRPFSAVHRGVCPSTVVWTCFGCGRVVWKDLGSERRALGIIASHHGTRRLPDTGVEAHAWLMAAVRRAALDVWTAKGVEAWLRAPNPWLDGATPSDLVARGDGRRVLAAIEAVAGGAFV